MINTDNLLLRHNYISIPADTNNGPGSLSQEVLATLVMNLSYYGKSLSTEAYKLLVKTNPSLVTHWWMSVEQELKDITGANRKIGDFVVYKNFPVEVLDKTEAEYWLPQILMYWGFPKELFTEEVKPRAKMEKAPKCTVLKLEKSDTLKNIYNSLLQSPVRWKEEEWNDVVFLSNALPCNFAKLAFKENLVRLAAYMMTNGLKVKVNTATDVLRLAAGLSDGDVALRDKFKFKSFENAERRFLLSMLDGCTNLEEDVARRPELFKRLFHMLHPGDHKRAYPNVWKVNNGLYNDQLITFNSQVEKLLTEKDARVLTLLSGRPGDFRRRLVHTLELFGKKAVKAFTAKEVLDKLTVAQVVGLRTYLETVNGRYHRVFPPKGNWTRVQVAEARHVDEKLVRDLSKALGKVLASRVPAVRVLDIDTKMVKLPSNDGEVSPYTRGTVFQIPEDVDFIRTASYWQNSGRTTWFDNGWNFFDENWKSNGSCCWTAPAFPMSSLHNRSANCAVAHFKGAAAIFSGDPVNTSDMKGRAAQLIDLYPDELRKQGVRYAVWNILCYSQVSFSEAEEVFAALQWGTGAQTGRLFEPSRCQLSLPLKGESMTKYVCVIDLQSMEMTYIDANLKGNTTSAGYNGATLEAQLPAFMEYIKSLPSVHDLFRESVKPNADIQAVLYSDKDMHMTSGSAYVFRNENKDNKYKAVDINSLLA